MAAGNRKNPQRCFSSDSRYSLMEFMAEFPNDEACLQWLWKTRLSPDGEHVLCPKCKVRYKPNPEVLRKANLPADKIKYFFRPPESDDQKAPARSGEDPAVCENCGGTGYRGRLGIFELFVINDRIRELLRENPNINALKQEAVKNGMEALQEDGLRQVIKGKTSIQELLRVAK